VVILVKPVSLRGSGAESGAAAVEFALVCVLLVMLVVGMVEIGRLYAAQLSVTHAAREGARAAAVGHFDAAYVKQQAVPLNPAFVTVGQSQGVDPSGDEYVQVTVSYPISIALVDNNWTRTAQVIHLSSSARMRAEY